jgi:predicted metal-dependent HD superfamily phosphohydrolase
MALHLDEERIKSDLRRAWNDAFYALNVPYDEIPLADHLFVRYEESHRSYHSLAHIWFVLEAIGQLSYLEPTVILAAFYHDCVYTIGAAPSANEIASALVMVGELGTVLPNYLIREISALILATYPGDYHIPPKTLNEAVLRDADLAGFSQDYEVVRSNGEKIRQEFVNFTDEQYEVGRGAFLKSLLDLGQIYWSPGAISSGWEQRARNNIECDLGTGSTPCSTPRCEKLVHPDYEPHLTQGLQWTYTSDIGPY